MKSLAITATLLGLLGMAIQVQASELELTESDDNIRIVLGDKPVLEYVKVAKPVPSGLSKHYKRNGYIHPLYTPTGEEFTGDFALDHPHQHGLFFAWTNTTFDGKKVDFWNQAKRLGNVEFREVVSTEKEEEQVSFRVRHTFTAGTGDKKVDALSEVWTVTVHHTSGDYFLFDIESVQRCASEKPLVLEKHKYGGMALRGNSQWVKEQDDHSINPGDLQFLTSEGKNRWEGNHTRAKWVAMTGKLGQQEVSVTVFCHPQNFRAPQHVRLHPNKPYFCFAPEVAGPFTIEPGQKYVSRYRYLVTSEGANEKLIAEQWQKYSAGGE